MMTRREVMTGGVLASAAVTPSAAVGVEQGREIDTQQLVRAIGRVEEAIEAAFETNSLAHGAIPKLRQYFEQFLRANAKFPDYCEVGSGVFFDLYDWHVKHGQPLVVRRQPDGRYLLQFMFSMLLLRIDADPNFIGYPYDNR
ncbi:MAG: hypothetical protein AB1635_14800 [Acidobacteriota bacterium]